MPRRSDLEQAIELLDIWGEKTTADVRLAATGDFNEKETAKFIGARNRISSSPKEDCILQFSPACLLNKR